MANPFSEITTDIAASDPLSRNIKIVRTEVEKSRFRGYSTTYVIEVRTGDRIDVIERRFQYLTRLMTELKKEAINAPVPGFPEQKSEKWNPRLGDERKPLLEQFLQICCNSSHPYSSTKALEAFLEPTYADILNSDVELVKEGYLWKEGHGVKNWKRRWFVLRSNPQLSLAYFKDPRDQTPAGVIYFAKDGSVRDAKEGEANKPGAFVVENPGARESGQSSKSQSKAYIVCAPDEQPVPTEDRHTWIKAIKQSLQDLRTNKKVAPQLIESMRRPDVPTIIAGPFEDEQSTKSLRKRTKSIRAKDVLGDRALSIMHSSAARERTASVYAQIENETVEKMLETGEWPVEEKHGKASRQFLELSERSRIEVIERCLDSREPPEDMRSIDHVLQYQISPPDATVSRRQNVGLLKKRRLRDIYLAILVDQGLILTEFPSHDKDEIFVHVYAPMIVLVQAAEKLHLKMKLRHSGAANPDADPRWHDSAEFTVSNYTQFKGYETPQKFFSEAQRSLIVRSVLLHAMFRRPLKAQSKQKNWVDKLCGCCSVEEESDLWEQNLPKEKGKVNGKKEDIEMNVIKSDTNLDELELSQKRAKLGIDHLVRDGVFTSYYPLHSEEATSAFVKHDNDEVEEEVVSKDWLIQNWARKVFSRQPLDKIRYYFGAKIGLYFAWLELYTLWLIIPSILGLITFMVGILQTRADGNTSMDNVLTIPFTLIMAIWATLYLEAWKRRNAEISYMWDVAGFEEEEPQRPDFYGRWKLSPVSGEMELYYPSWRRKLKYIVGGVGIAGMLSVVVIAAVGILAYRVAFTVPNPGAVEHKILAGVINAIVIMILNAVYGVIAVKLTNWENHSTETEYEDQLIAKTFLFQFINSYITLFYIAFFKSNAAIWRGLGIPYTDTCNPDCLTELSFQLGAIFVSKITVDNIKEVFVPYLSAKFALWRETRGMVAGETLTQWEREAKLPLYPGTFDEYSEMVIQFGYVTLFVAAFPLAPLCALINNVIELRSDATKILVGHRRPPALIAEDIGTWYAFLNLTSIVSVITNTLIIAFTSTQLPVDRQACTGDCRNMWQFWSFIILEHALLTLKYAFAEAIPDVPEWVQTATQRELYRLKEAKKEEQRELENIEIPECYDPENRATFTRIAELIQNIHTPDVVELLPKSRKVKKKKEEDRDVVDASSTRL